MRFKHFFTHGYNLMVSLNRTVTRFPSRLPIPLQTPIPTSTVDNYQTMEEITKALNRISGELPLYRSTYEYCGVQRSGKDTLMTNDLLYKVYPQCPNRRVISNTNIDPPSGSKIEYFKSEALITEILRIKKAEERDTVVYFSEASQFVGARGYASKIQTELATFFWQADKRNILLLLSDNLGNSIDIQLSLAMHFLIMPHYHFGATYAEDWIDALIANLRTLKTGRVKYYGLFRSHAHYNSIDPIS